MAVSGPWYGSSGVNETGERWGSAIGRKLRLSTPHWVSSWGNRSWELRVDITWSEHNAYGSYWHQQMLNVAGGSWPDPSYAPRWRIVVHGGCQWVAATVNDQVGWFGGSIAGTVTVENHGWILGRGGSGGNVPGAHESNCQNGYTGGHAIYREGHVTLYIENYGVIGGGGGGGGSAYTFSSAGGGRHFAMGGGGGAPFGAGGYTSGMNNPRPGAAAGIDYAGAGGNGGDRGEANGGGGGMWGNSGGNAWGGNRANTAGGPSGYAIAGWGPLGLTVQGDLRGPVAW